MIDKNMSIMDIVGKYPQTMSLFQRYGLSCAGCRAALFESIEQGAKIHGIDINAFLEDINLLISKK